MRVYAEQGPPTFISVAIFAGTRPKPKASAAPIQDFGDLEAMAAGMKASGFGGMFAAPPIDLSDTP